MTVTPANEALHESKVDDTQSGTTAITVTLHKDTLLVANVGDSRAIIASEFGDKLRYSPLSSDQTPFRVDERERVKLQGARVLTIEQIEGNEPLHEDWGAEGCDIIDEVGDPPRVWNDSLEQPGCAFTRSTFGLFSQHTYFSLFLKNTLALSFQYTLLPLAAHITPSDPPFTITSSYHALF